MELLGNVARTTMDEEVNRLDRHGVVPLPRSVPELIAKGRNGARRMDLGLVELDSIDIVGMATVEDVVADDPHLVAITRPLFREIGDLRSTSSAPGGR